jgi:chromosome segregation ATPase
MAKGISETDVHRAADAVVAAGERPTVERIRTHLGTGSPNTVTRWLDTWWKGLDARLANDRSRRALPEAPSAIATLATELWEQALLAARTEADAKLAENWAALAAERAGMEQALAHARRNVAAHQEAAATAKQARVAADTRLADAERLIEQQAAQRVDLAAQRDALSARLDAIETERAALAESLQQHEAVARAEREAQLQHARSLEDRAHGEVDRARQETKALQHRLDTLHKEHAARDQVMAQRNEESRAALAEALRTAAIQQSRAEALQQQLSQLSEWQASVQAALAQATKPTARGRAEASPGARVGKKRRKPKAS